MRKIDYQNFHLSKYNIPTAKSLEFLMLKLSSLRDFWESRDLRNACQEHIIMPNNLKQLTFRTGSHPGTNRLDYNLSWSLHNLYKVGALDQLAYAKYCITKLGKQALSLSNNSHELSNFLKQYNHKSKRTSINKENREKSSSLYERIGSDVRAFNKRLEDQLYNAIFSKNPYFFEKLVVQLLAKMGYKGVNGIARRTQGSRDHGIDGIIKKDPLGTSTVYIQAKRYKKGNKVNVNDIKNFSTSIRDKHSSRGVFITTSSFNAGAKAEAKRHSIVLIDGKKLMTFMIKYEVGVQVQRVYKIANLDKDFFSEY